MKSDLNIFCTELQFDWDSSSYFSHFYICIGEERREDILQFRVTVENKLDKRVLAILHISLALMFICMRYVQKHYIANYYIILDLNDISLFCSVSVSFTMNPFKIV